MIAGKGPDTVGAQELVFVQHGLEYPAQFGFVQNSSQPPVLLAGLDWS